jgi:ubiquinone biosynthesis protein UbiJ
VPNEEKVVVEIELDPAQLEQVLGEIAELRAEVARLAKRVQNLQNQLDAGPLPDWRA